jgi:hypothetical protein
MKRLKQITLLYVPLVHIIPITHTLIAHHIHITTMTSSETRAGCPVEATDSWKLYIHLTNDPDWSVSSYKVVDTVDTVDGAIALMNNMPQSCVDNGMLFFMRGGVKPVWEDPENRNGGCFSYKVEDFRKASPREIFKRICYAVMTDTLCDSADFMRSITGVTISPKLNFYIIKLWVGNKRVKSIGDVRMDTELHALRPDACIFKEHVPEF